eukprot:13603052-Alexandrium_andersonii.AAC.1
MCIRDSPPPQPHGGRAARPRPRLPAPTGHGGPRRPGRSQSLRGGRPSARPAREPTEAGGGGGGD